MNAKTYGWMVGLAMLGAALAGCAESNALKSGENQAAVAPPAAPTSKPPAAVASEMPPLVNGEPVPLKQVPTRSEATPEEEALMAKIRTVLPAGWTVNRNHDDKRDVAERIVIEREKPVPAAWPSGEGGSLNGSNESTTNNEHVEYWLIEMEYVSPAGYQKSKALAGKVQAAYQNLLMRGIPQAIMDEEHDFSPHTPEEAARVNAYNTLRAQIGPMPEFYYQNLSYYLSGSLFLTTSSYYGQATIEDPAEARECADVEKKVKSLLTLYDPAHPPVEN
jgi:hypothetical protein